jgi:hypothetical protein
MANTDSEAAAVAMAEVPDNSITLGEGKLPKGNRIGWVRRQLRRGAFLARHGWRCEPAPRRMWVQLETHQETEILSTKFEHTRELAKFSRLNWADLDADDWYVVNQLELVR